jgi:hypothetical protein
MRVKLGAEISTQPAHVLVFHSSFFILHFFCAQLVLITAGSAETVRVNTRKMIGSTYACPPKCDEARSVRICVALLSVFIFALGARAADSLPEQAEFFEKKIRPVFFEHCFKCHAAAAKKVKGGLLLDSREGLLKGGDSGPAIFPGQPQQSRLIEAVRYQNVDLQMPPKGKLPGAVIDDLEAWVKMGAPWPASAAVKADGHKYDFDLSRRKQEHWSWQPLRPQSPPQVKRRDWPRNPIDHFILDRLEAKNLTPAFDADGRTLIRRIYFDLIGLPPTSAEVAAFVKDSSPGAFMKVVEGLLDSPHFGERWARHWLDLVRYGETRGHEFDYLNPNAFQYRDYVIRAFNADVPYDQFVIEHIAGDLIKQPRLHPKEGFNESILGTGFWFLGEQVHSPVDLCQDKADRFDNMIDVMTKTFLSLTVACARCHDHKFDAISTKDYYALFGFLQSSSYRLARFDSMEQNRDIAEQLWKVREQSGPKLQQALAASWTKGLTQVAEYLLAAREALQTGTSAAHGFAEIAAARKLNTDALERWVATLIQAEKNSGDPLHVWAKAARANIAPNMLPRDLLQDWHQQTQRAAVARRRLKVIVDYAASANRDWLPDGVAYGPGPVRPGDVRFGTDPAKPIVRFIDYAAAEKDPTWDNLRLAPGAESDPGTLGNTPRSGRMIRTPTFRIDDGMVYYLVKGAGQVYAAVDGHMMIAGPLHAGLVMSLPASPEFRWVTHNLSAYKGRLTHVEFTPALGAELAVAVVAQGAEPPQNPQAPNLLLMKRLSAADSTDALARAYQKLLTDVAERVAKDRLRVSSADYAALANWMLQHQELIVKKPQADYQAEAKRLLAEQAKLIVKIRPESRLALAMLDGNGINEHVYIRGTYKSPGPIVPRRFLEALAGPEGVAANRGSGRLELARQMVDSAVNRYLPRVMINRIWQHLFGRGIVASVDNFGVLGEQPTHPELLDYLSDRFVKEGWSIKKMIRLMVLSRAYQMSSAPTKAQQADPENLLLHRMRIRRLEGEAIRDAMLAVSCRLEGKLFGPPVPVYLTSFQDGRGRPASGPLDGNGRRSIYLSVRRNFLPAMLLAFDTPIPFSTVGRRTVSNVPAQALILMNDPFVHQQAEAWAKKELAHSASIEERIGRMYLSAFGRSPSAAELAACTEFLGEQDQQRAGNDLAAWSRLAHVLFNAKEFIFLN